MGYSKDMTDFIAYVNVSRNSSPPRIQLVYPISVKFQALLMFCLMLPTYKIMTGFSAREVLGLVSQPDPNLGNYLLPLQFKQDTPFIFITRTEIAVPICCALLQ